MTLGTTDLLLEFSHVLFHNNAPYHSKRNLRLVCESMYGKLTRKQHEQLYEQHVAQGVAISAQNATTYTCPLYTSLLSLVATLGEELVAKRVLCFSYGSGCAASMYGICVQQLPEYPKDVFAQLSNRDVKSVYETLQLVQAHEDAYRSFPFKSAHTTEHRLPEVYYIEQVSAQGVRQYTKRDSCSAVSKRELGSVVVQIEPLQLTLGSRLLANLQPSVLHVMVPTEVCRTEQLSAGRMPRLAEFEDHLQLQWWHDGSPVLVVSNQYLIHDSNPDAVGLGAANACSVGLVDAVSSTAAVELLMGHWQQQVLGIGIPAIGSPLNEESLLLPVAGQSAGVELDWAVAGVAELRLDMGQSTVLEELTAVAWTLGLHSELVAVVLCGGLRDCQTMVNAAMHTSACLSMLMAPLFGILNGHVEASGATIALACDWRTCTQVVLFGFTNETTSECLNAHNLGALGITEAANVEPSAAVAAALELACSMQYAPPLGLQHCLQLMRFGPPIDSGVQQCLTNCATAHLPGALQTLVFSRCCQNQLVELHMAQSSWALHNKHSVANGSASVVSLKGQIGNTCNLQTLMWAPVRHVHLHATQQASQPPAVPTLDCAAFVSVHDLLLPTVHLQLGAVANSLVTLSHTAEGRAVLELNDKRHYNAMDLPLMHALRSKLAHLTACTRLHSVVLQGAGAHFCSGGAAHSDAVMPRVAPDSAASLSVIVKDMSSCVKMLQELSVPLLSVLHGKLTGGGVALALNTDWRVCTLAAKFNHGNLPRGLNPIGGYSQAFGVAIGSARAQVMYGTDGLVGGGLVLMLGLVDALETSMDTAKYTARCTAVEHPSLHCTLHHELETLESVLHSICALDNSMLMSQHSASTEPSVYRSESYQLRGDETLSFKAFPASRVLKFRSEHVEVRLGAVGINFREVLFLLGMVSIPNGTIGGEATGIVVSVRDESCGFAEGNAVCGWIGNDFCNYSTPPLGSMVRYPRHISCEESATMYTVWLTVGHAFRTLCGDLRCGEIMLTHAATGGVGISSLWLAQSKGAMMLVTAGSERKRAWLREQRVDFLSTTRDAEQLNCDLTCWLGAQSLTLVLNALSNRFIQIGFDQMQTV